MEAGLGDLLRGCEILVCLLPLTPQTQGILNAALFERLPDGACLVNAGRGAHLVDSDLLAALESGRIAGATLDVFHEEPLPATHPFWSHPAITVTPHIAAFTHPETAVARIVANIRRTEASLPPVDVVDRERGY